MGNNVRRKVKKRNKENRDPRLVRDKMACRGYETRMDPDWFIMYRAAKLGLI
jgi:hypothetical protein